MKNIFRAGDESVNDGVEQKINESFVLFTQSTLAWKVTNLTTENILNGNLNTCMHVFLMNHHIDLDLVAITSYINLVQSHSHLHLTTRITFFNIFYNIIF